MKNSLLFLRSFGDFVIALSVISKSNSTSSYRFIASVHLEPLYKAIRKKFPDLPIQVEFHDFHIRKKILGAFTNKHLLDLHSFKELKQLAGLVKELSADSIVYLEQQRRLWLTNLFMPKHNFIHANGNIYASYGAQFDVTIPSLFFATGLPSPKKIMIFPESRKPDKAFSPAFVQDLVNKYQHEEVEVSVAFFKQEPYPVKAKVVFHDSFDDLLELVETADEILTADSLPAHLAQLMTKPHRVYYPKAVDEEWVTPYCKANQTFGIF